MKNIHRFLCLLLLVVGTAACHKDPPPPPVPQPPVDFPTLPVPPQNNALTWTQTTIDSSEGNGLICKTQLVKWGPEYTDVVSLNPQEDVVYPGAVFNYESFQKGTYQPIIGDRKPITFSTSLPGQGVGKQTVDKPSLSEVRDRIRTMLYPYDGATTAKMGLKSNKIYSKEHFGLAIGGNFKSPLFDIAGQFDFDNSEIKSHVLIEFTQEYYSIDLDTPEPGLGSWFNELKNEEQLGPFSPVYVSSVRYGRKVFILLESRTLSYDQLLNVKANFTGALNGGGVAVDQTVNKLLEEKSIQVAVMGGSSEAAINLITNIDELNTFLKAGAKYSNQSPGVPLSYTLRFIANNDIAKLQLYDEFTLSECYPNTAQFEIPDVTFLCPKSVAGDNEFNANGPNVEARAWLTKENGDKEIWAHITFSLKEIGGDHTEGLGSWDGLVYTAPGNRKINSIMSDNYAEWVFEDTGDGLDEKTWNADELVRKMEVMGDTAGEDLGACDANHSFLNVYFNQVKLKLN